MDEIFESLEQIPYYENYLYAGILIFIRFLGFAIIAPALSRKEVPQLLKVAFALLMTMTFLGSYKDITPPAENSLIISVILNFIFGLLIGFIAITIFETIRSAGEMINMQMGLQSSMMFDQNAKGQSSIMGIFFMHLGTIIFIHIGGLFWLFLAFKRGFEIFPLYGASIPLQQIVNLDYMIYLTGNVLFIGLQMASPIIITTLCQDIVLGIISKTAPQVNVFQLSFLFKPVVGSLIMLIILPLLVNAIVDYFNYFSQIY
ncbi:MAG TPA: flagellar biosynthetic protein FliR [Candidatus Gastranaerophilales bacterium]|nr:flagellar biosynthetic protein FliR [Candidatus Gastranaerophilales bacterium]